jgi:D-amino peptidase
MRVHVLTDLEGISGIDDIEQVSRDGPHFRASCEKLMLDANAAVAGAFDGGATYVSVLDGHAGGGNFIVEMLDPRAENAIRDKVEPRGMLDESYDGVFAIGAHAMAGTINGFLDHTQSSASWHNYYLNGRKFGEIGQWGVHAGAFGVPVLMISGDEAACAEARAFYNPIETAAVKQGVGRNCAIGLPEAEARVRIREAARRAMALVGKARPLKPICPMQIILELYRSDFADRYAEHPGVERLDARTVRKVSSNPRDIIP